ncbi:complement regulator-acquiring protein (plasmid) [Borreliella carolinensis]|uniref:Complement regulator-acquiring protein n=1 Tax=Borreliella carolinensis TaxID=478174 RepID=A0ABY9E7H3_9SPIR|nr:complement regulator-acquiring protein [Borreliella carolinensis]WKC90409.1 complement regulator-acquiring protein [Borreliella carolinensis]WNY63388.1 complement regulator-acquiring protein [Borreliella carolinensis]WNY68236.1 complement regulator-acquiring protein [Borreliella carolinensis]
MTKAKSNIIKLNIIMVILTLICISCAPLSKIDPKVNESTNPKKRTNPEKSTDPEKSTQNPEDTPGDFRPSDQELLENIISELKAIGKKLEDQKKEEDTQIAKIAADNFDFLNTFKVASLDTIDDSIRIKTKRIIYSSLDYQKEKINTLKGIFETLQKNPKNYNIVGKLLYHISVSTQLQIEESLALIQNEIDNLNLKEAKSLLAEIKSDLKKKKRIKKTLNETLKAYNQDDQGIKTNEEKLAEHFNKYYEDFDTLMPLS